MKETRVCILDGGSLAIDGYKVYWNRGPGGDIRFPVYSVLIDHEEGLFIYDTGFDLEHMRTQVPQDKPEQTPDQTLPRQLALVGRKTSDVTHVLTSHLHIDHAGGHKHFPQATVVCHEDEYAQAAKPPLFEKLSYSDLAFDPALSATRDGLDADPELPSPQYQLVRGDLEVARGVWLLETPGHSAGHYSLLVKLENRRPMLFCGDVAMTPRNLELMCIGSFHLDPPRALASLQRVQELSEEHDAEIFFSHSMPEFEKYLRAPDWYV